MYKQFDRNLVKNLLDVLGDNDPYYMQLAYTELKLQKSQERDIRIDYLEKAIDLIQNNHLTDIDKALKDMYSFSKDLVEIKEWMTEYKQEKFKNK